MYRNGPGIAIGIIIQACLRMDLHGNPVDVQDVYFAVVRGATTRHPYVPLPATVRGRTTGTTTSVFDSPGRFSFFSLGYGDKAPCQARSCSTSASDVLLTPLSCLFTCTPASSSAKQICPYKVADGTHQASATSNIMHVSTFRFFPISATANSSPSVSMV